MTILNRIAWAAGAALLSAALANPAAAQATPPRPTLQVGTTPVLPYGSSSGFFAELITAVGEIAGFDVAFQLMPLGNTLPALVSNTIDISAGGGMDIPANRALPVSFTRPIALVAGGFVVRTGDTLAISDIADLQGQPVGVAENTPWHSQLTAAGLTDIRPFVQVTDMFAALENGTVRAIYTNPYLVTYQQQVLGMHAYARIADTYLNTGFPPAIIAVRNTDTALLASINAALDTLRANGTLAELAARYRVALVE